LSSPGRCSQNEPSAGKNARTAPAGRMVRKSQPPLHEEWCRYHHRDFTTATPTAHCLPPSPPPPILIPPYPLPPIIMSGRLWKCRKPKWNWKGAEFASYLRRCSFRYTLLLVIAAHDRYCCGPNPLPITANLSCLIFTLSLPPFPRVVVILALPSSYFKTKTRRSMEKN
jgi:hypothetical protein